MTPTVQQQANFTLDEAAEYLRISTRELKRCLHTTDPLDHLPSATVGEKRTKRILRRADLDAWLARHMDQS